MSMWHVRRKMNRGKLVNRFLGRQAFEEARQIAS